MKDDGGKLTTSLNLHRRICKSSGINVGVETHVIRKSAALIRPVPASKVFYRLGLRRADFSTWTWRFGQVRSLLVGGRL